MQPHFPARLPHASGRRRGPAILTTVAAALALTASLTACESMDQRQRDTARGAGVGAAAGAVIGSATGHSAGRGAVLGGAVGAIAGNVWSRRMEQKRQALEQSTSGSGVAVERTPDNRLRVEVPNDISFATGSAQIAPTMRPLLDDVVRTVDGDMRVTVVGHTDNTGSAAINDALSLERAQAVRDYLNVRGVEAQRIGVAGRGSREPVADNTTESGRARNRRVEIFLADTAG